MNIRGKVSYIYIGSSLYDYDDDAWFWLTPI